MYLIIGLLFIVIGFFTVAKPKDILQAMEHWKYSGSAEPSKKYVLFFRSCGIVMLIWGVVCCAAQFSLV